MAALIGTFSLCAAVLVALGAFLLAAGGWLRAARWMVVGYTGLLSLAAGMLVVGLVGSDFSIEYVTHYTEKALPVGYKLAAFWAGQEGSILLWAWLLGAMAVVYVVGNRKAEGAEARASLATLVSVLGFMAVLMLFAANPFKTTAEVPVDGHGLNPMLQDPGMIAHPPMLFLGYAGFTVPFAMMMGALVAGRKDDGWVLGTRRWVLASWLFLSIGILLGAQWAYVELGWGGYWAWDPVENASLLPWLTGTALVHSIMVQQARGMMRLWNAGLYAGTFALCIFGTYITRSGIISSVHSFGESLVGTLFLVFLVMTVVASVGVIVWRRRMLKPASEMAVLVGREGAFMMVNVLLTGMTVLTLVGTMWPLISSVVGIERTLDQSYYNRAVAPMGMVLVALMAVGPVLVYGVNPGKKILRAMAGPGVVAAAVVAALAGVGVRNGWGLVCGAVSALALGVIVGDFAKAVRSRMRALGENVVRAMVCVFDGNHRRYGGQVVHVGVIMIMVGVVGSSVFGVKETYQLKPGESVKFAGQEMTFVALEERPGPNYTSVDATIRLTGADGTTRTFHPERRYYAKSEQPSTEVAIQSTWKEDVYLTLAGWENGGAVTSFQAVVNPLVSWIWTGGVVMSLGAIVCLMPRVVRGKVEAGAEEPAAGEAVVMAGRHGRVSVAR